MPEKLDRCVKKLKKQLRKDHPDWDADKIERVAWATCVKSTGQHPSDEESEDEPMTAEPKKLSWTSNITVYESFDTALNNVIKKEGVRVVHGLEEARFESLRETDIDGVKGSENHFYIVGDAIHAVTTANLHTYLAEELEVATETLSGKPVMVDHSKGSLDNAGKVMVTTWESRSGLDSAITYIARVRKSHPVAEAVMLGDIDSVSIGATADKIECSVCGEDMLQCPHHIGKTYEVNDGEPILATAIGRGLVFRELSITPFPADARASAYATNNSLYAAVETLVESSENKHKLQKAGATKKMSEDNNEELALAREVQTMRDQIEQLNNEKESALKEVQVFQEEKKADLVDRVFEMEVVANIKESKDEMVRTAELKIMTAENLQARADTLKSVITTQEKMTPTSKAIVTDEPAEVVEKPVKDPLIYTSSEVKTGIRQFMGMRTSQTAQLAVRKWAVDSSNPMVSEYKQIISTNSAKLRGGSN
jgi:hypothetical protein